MIFRTIIEFSCPIHCFFPLFLLVLFYFRNYRQLYSKTKILILLKYFCYLNHFCSIFGLCCLSSRYEGMLPFPTCNTKSNMTLKLSMIKFYQNDYIKCSFSNITTEILTVHTNFTKKLQINYNHSSFKNFLTYSLGLNSICSSTFLLKYF